MNPKQFLVWGGAILVVVGLLGMFALIGPTAGDSIFGSFWYFDMYENWAHLILGIVALVAAFVFPAKAQKPLVLIVGIVALLFAIYSLAISEDFYGAMLQNPADTILHFVIAIWAIFAGLCKGNVLDKASASVRSATSPEVSPIATAAQPVGPTATVSGQGGPEYVSSSTQATGPVQSTRFEQPPQAIQTTDRPTEQV